MLITLINRYQQQIIIVIKCLISMILLCWSYLAPFHVLLFLLKIGKTSKRDIENLYFFLLKIVKIISKYV